MNYKDIAMEILCGLEVAPQSELTAIELDKVANELARSAQFQLAWDNLSEMVAKAYIKRLKEIK